MLDPAELKDRPRVQDEQFKELVAGGGLGLLFMPTLPSLVSDKSAVESWFESLLAGAIVRSGCVTIPIAITKYRRETASAPAVSV